jgi:uncharacterized membrane protein
LPVYLAILFCLPETLRCLVGNGEVFRNKSLFTLPRLRQKPLVNQGKFPQPPKPSLRNWINLLIQPTQFIVFVNGALSFAGLYLIYVSFPDVWAEKYGFSTAEVGYAYLSPGMLLLTLAPLSDCSLSFFFFFFFLTLRKAANVLKESPSSLPPS